MSVKKDAAPPARARARGPPLQLVRKKEQWEVRTDGKGKKLYVYRATRAWQYEAPNCFKKDRAT